MPPRWRDSQKTDTIRQFTCPAASASSAAPRVVDWLRHPSRPTYRFVPQPRHVCAREECQL